MEWWNDGKMEERSNKLTSCYPLLAKPNIISIINFVELRFAPVPVFQKHNISIKVLINNDITNNLIPNSCYYTKKNPSN